ncbi:MAG: bacillithiol biosynthesis cysteine-adding enzyme BshC, partial [Bacteroidetes bacterium]
DHDFEEINHAWVFGRRISWETEAGGPVGRLSTDSLRPALDALKEVLGDRPEATRWYALIEEAYTRYPRYGQATQALVHGLFGKYGLVALLMDEPRLKAAFRPIIREEVLQQASHPIVTATQARLQEQGFEPQAYVRPVNFFYMTDTSRERIEPDGEGFRLVESGRFFAKAEMEAEIEAHPERFSPNVVMRPVYQEFILPNLAYVGGGGEIAYWLERREQFAHFGVPFPMLVRRNSALWIDRTSARRMEKLGLQVTDLFEVTEVLIKRWLAAHAEEPFSLEAERQELEALFARVAAKARAVDPTMEKKVLAEGARQLKALENIETRLVRAEKQKHDQAISQIRKLRDKLFPDGKLQERHDNFLNIVTRVGEAFFEVLLAHLDPMDRRFVVFVE